MIYVMTVCCCIQY